MVKIKINGDNWQAQVLEEDKFIKRCGDGTAAVTLPNTKSMLFSADSVDLKTVIHELTHAYYSYLCLSATELTNEQLEEVFCEFMAEKGAEILRQSRKLLRSLSQEM